ncbi:6-bladed beta-propeller [Lentisphaera profundi]|uniref:6-bladed beta-propeller n=1 Tax=Lentisphaera profundi TaxID=1658616 RepID=A0ABY7VZY1_9BACT|nr:6-bladed beta-propeller [Lentisphaera profundi]WDE98813.1 6-bladed beta-propeller [Lentisphaera profundi]
MKTFTFIALSSLSIFAHAPNDDHKHKAAPDHQQVQQDEIIGHGSHQYKVHKDWGKLDKTKYPIKNCHAMIQLKDGNFVALCDDNKHNFLKYSPEGKLLKAWIKEYPGAHGIEVFEKDGKDHFVVVDSGWAVRNGKQYRETGRVAITTAAGQLVFALGHPQTVGAYEPGQKYMPCDAAVAPNGDIYVADGYGSQWVLQYDKNGRFISKFGGASDPDKNAILRNSHGISIDLRDPQNPKLLVSSRGENKIKVFTMDGKFIENIDLPGAFGGQAVVHGENLYVGVCWSKKDGTGKKLNESGFVAILDKDNKVISCPGGSEPQYVDGEIQPMYQTTKTFYHVHDLCVDTQGNIFVVQWKAKGAYPIKLEIIKK